MRGSRVEMMAIDFDAEGERLLAKLNLRTSEPSAASASARPSLQRLYNNLDAIWEHPVTRARVYVGNITAASTRSILDEHGIRHVINCQEEGSKNFFEAEKGGGGRSSISYLRFPISQWWRSRMDSHEDVLRYFERPFAWAHAATSSGSSVLIHCLAGAHRAGTTGVAFVMWSSGLEARVALPLARRLRNIIDPIGMLGELLTKYDAALKAHPHAALGRVLAPPPDSSAGGSSDGSGSAADGSGAAAPIASGGGAAGSS